MLNKYFDNIIDKEFITEEIFYGSLLDKWLKSGYEVILQLFTYSDEENIVEYNPILIINIENIERFKRSNRENYGQYHEIILDTNYIDDIAIEEIMEDDRVAHKIDDTLKEFTGTFTSGVTLYYEVV